MKESMPADETSAGPHMRDSIKIRSSTRKGKGNAVVTLRVGPSKQHHMKALAQEFGTVKQVADPLSDPPGLQPPDRFARVNRGNRNGIENR